jgi:hypothetical protein
MNINFRSIWQVYKITMSRLTLFLLLLIAGLVVFGCSEDNGNPQQLHYYNPVWTPNGKAVVFGMYRGIPSSGTLASSLLYIADTSGRRMEFTVAPMNTLNRRFWFDPVSGALAFAQNGISFYFMPDLPSTTSSLAGTYTPSLPGRQPSVISFNPQGHSFLWAGTANGTLTIANVTYGDQPWSPTGEAVLLDSATTTSIQDIIFVSETTYAVRFSDGKIRHYDFLKGLIHEYAVIPFIAENPWQYHLAYYNAGGTPQRVYAAQQSGFVELLLDSLKSKLLVDGLLINYDINEAARSMIYETSSFDIWLATQEAIPLARLMPHNGMGRFSPSGNYLAAVGKVSSLTDSITVRKIRN